VLTGKYLLVLEEYSALIFRVKQSKVEELRYINNHLPLDLGQYDLKKRDFIL